MAHQLAIETHGLSKRYGGRAAVAGLDLAVPSGVVAGFVGPNGAGKTTTLAMLLGLVTPTGGTGSVLGMPIDEDLDIVAVQLDVTVPQIDRSDVVDTALKYRLDLQTARDRVDDAKRGVGPC